MKSIRRSLKNDRHQSPPSSADSQKLSNSIGASMQQQQQHHQQQGPHHVLGNGVHSIQSPISTLPPGAQQGKTPPSKVIRAIESYRSKGPPELSFEAGDFFHVMGDGHPRTAGNNSNEELWYDAHNPLTRARGIVPASYFQVLGKTQKDTPPNAGNLNTPPLSPPSQARSLPLQAMQPFQQASGSSSSLNLAAANGISPGPSPSATTFPHRTTSASQASSSSTSKPRARPSPLYGVVQYDFRAERADELDAKRGEPIIVIAQSNHEWFVAKPIGRLGGPGLIPVSFVAISDTTTGEALPQEKVRDMIASGMVPPVEEWKKATAEYKQSSIPLGRFDLPGTNPTTSGTSPFGQQQQASSSSVNLPYGQSMSNNSANNSSASLPHNQQSRVSQGAASNASRGFNPTASTSSLHKQQPQQPSSTYDDQPLPSRQSHEQQHQQQQYAPSSSLNGSVGRAPTQPYGQASSSSHIPSVPSGAIDERERNLSPDEDNYQFAYQPGEPGSEPYFYDRYGLVTHATVESFHAEEENFWFHLRVNFGMAGYSLILYRLYDDFLEFQYALMDVFQVEAGRALPHDAPPGAVPNRIIPKMPGPVEIVDEVVCAQRVSDLTIYLDGLCALPDYMKYSALVYEFFMPRAGDVTVQKPDAAAKERWLAQKATERETGGPSHYQRGLDEEVVEYLDQMGSVTDAMQRTSLGASPVSQQQQQQLPNGKASHTALPQLNTSAGSSNSPFTPGYSLSSSAGGPSQHGRQNSGTIPPPSALSSSQPGGYSSRLSDHSAPPMSAGSGVLFNSPWAQSATSAAPPAPPPTTQQATAASTVSPPPFVKIKIFHRNTDDLIAIRVPPSIRLDALLDKVRERLGGDVSHVRYRDEGERPVSQAQAASALTLPGGARLIELRSDEELDSWMKGTQRLVAYVD